MIEKNTVLILGAGASMPYGFPSGKQLISEIYHLKANIADPLIRACNNEDNTAKSFFRELVMADPPSIDTYLSQHPKYLKIGKGSIAQVISSHEKEDSLYHIIKYPKNYTKDTRWYHLLFELIHENILDGGLIPLSIITFNYDRSLEKFIYNKLKYMYDKTNEEIKLFFKYFKIIHVYGKIGTLPELKDNNDEYIRYYDNAIITEENLIKASNQISLIYDKNPINIIKKEIEKVIVNANNIYFMGFGYHQDNCDILMIDKYAPKDAVIKGTTYELTELEVHRIQKFASRIEFFEVDCKDFMRNSAMFDDEGEEIDPYNRFPEIPITDPLNGIRNKYRP